MTCTVEDGFEQSGVFFIYFDEIDKVLDSEVREGHHAASPAPDPYHNMFDFNFVGDVVQPVRAFAEIIGDTVNRRDVGSRATWGLRRPTLVVDDQLFRERRSPRRRGALAREINAAYFFPTYPGYQANLASIERPFEFD